MCGPEGMDFSDEPGLVSTRLNPTRSHPIGGISNFNEIFVSGWLGFKVLKQNRLGNELRVGSRCELRQIQRLVLNLA